MTSAQGTTPGTTPGITPGTGPLGFDATLEISRRSLETAFAMTASMLEGWRTINDAWVGFSRTQIESNRTLLQSLATCDDPMKALALQFDGAQAALSRCVSAATTTSDVASKLAAEALALPARASKIAA